MIQELLNNPVLAAGLIAWAIGQALKLPISRLVDKRWDWRVMFTTGGMPSSHSSLVTGTTLAIGLFEGFNTPLFALALAVSMVIVYDAAGVRRQAGMHARMINRLVEELFPGQSFDRDRLKEVLGHSPLEVIAGVLLGLFTALTVWAAAQ